MRSADAVTGSQSAYYASLERQSTSAWRLPPDETWRSIENLMKLLRNLRRKKSSLDCVLRRGGWKSRFGFMRWALPRTSLVTSFTILWCNPWYYFDDVYLKSHDRGFCGPVHLEGRLNTQLFVGTDRVIKEVGAKRRECCQDSEGPKAEILKIRDVLCQALWQLVRLSNKVTWGDWEISVDCNSEHLRIPSVASLKGIEGRRP